MIRRGPAAADLLSRHTDRTAPLITHYAGPQARVELSVASAANGVAKAAGLLRDGLDLEPGATLSVDLPLHWQLPIWTLAGLAVGAEVGRGLPGPVAVRVVGVGDPVVTGSDPLRDAEHVLVSACDAFGMPVRGGVPAGVLDVGVEARGYPDVFLPDPGAAASAGLRRAEAFERIGALDPELPAGARVWIESLVEVGAGQADASPVDIGRDELHWLCLRPVLVGGSMVLALGMDPDSRARLIEVEHAVTLPR